MKKKRPAVQIEQLETRVTPDITFGQSASALIQFAPAAGTIGGESVTLSKPPLTADLSRSLGANASPLSPDTSYLQALGRIFSDSDELERIFRPDGSTLTAESGDPSTDALSASRYVMNYSKKAISNDEAKYGPLGDHEDLAHQIYVEWLQQAGNGNSDLARLMNKDSVERQVLRKTVRRVLDHARYEVSKQRRMVELVDQPAPANQAEQDWIDMQIDAASGSLQLDPRERQLLELRREGKTLEEIGLEMGLIKQRVSEMYNSALNSLQDLYSE